MTDKGLKGSSHHLTSEKMNLIHLFLVLEVNLLYAECPPHRHKLLFQSHYRSFEASEFIIPKYGGMLHY